MTLGPQKGNPHCTGTCIKLLLIGHYAVNSHGGELRFATSFHVYDATQGFEVKAEGAAHAEVPRIMVVAANWNCRRLPQDVVEVNAACAGWGTRLSVDNNPDATWHWRCSRVTWFGWVPQLLEASE